MEREKGILYSISSWDGKFYNHTNKNAEDFKIDVSDSFRRSRMESIYP
jgi:oligopeptidase B